MTEKIDFELCPYGDSGNCNAAAALRSVGDSDWTGGVQRSKLRCIPNWGRNRAVKTNRLVSHLSDASMRGANRLMSTKFVYMILQPYT